MDRLLAVVFPLRQKEIMEKCGLKVMLIVSWAFPISVAVSYVVLPVSFLKTFLATLRFALRYAGAVIIVSYLLIVAFLLKAKKKRNQTSALTLPVLGWRFPF